MEFLAGETLVRKSQEKVSADEVLADKEIVAFYFSAHWCPPCKRFTPILADFYEELTDAEKPFEIIFVSSDQTAEGMAHYMEESHGDWLAVPHGAALIGKLKEKFEVSGIPMLVVVKKDGTVIRPNGRNDVETKGAQAYDDWTK